MAETTETEDEFMSIASANWPSLMAFLACDTQWRVVGSMVGFMWIGLDWAGCNARLAHRPSSEAIFADMAIMEDAALSILNGGVD